MSVMSSLQKLKNRFKASPRMPVVFLGHGSPMNVIEDNEFTRSWVELGRTLPRPQAILVVSAHWMTQGSTLVDVSALPRTIHDFYGFPDALYEKQYPAKGHPELAKEVAALLSDHHVHTDDTWGLDHGAWSVLNSMFPAADVPVFQLSIDITKDMNWHLSIGKKLSELRDRGVLILGSGNIVHNLRALQFDGKPHDWAIEFDQYVADQLNNRDFKSLADVASMGSLLRMANPTLEHYAPALTIAGASNLKDELIYTSQGVELGSISMRSFVFNGA
ncbi:4,5-DOPA dioxygenase extradiol [Vibrio natriegens]|uniref:4,5-DOPA-extradiol-dioxygenase n=1 Tax=Vibrio sp. (strain EJY3) TaxID=1116375 RepID=UPI000243BFB4|nr:4,5-DOPA dioxygenase extradiol [Vibrio sp. EJY3]AEX21722.1 extradiol ring-cleavage dioxygenase III subunit B [Vibrio sp. EJY3]CAH0529226.1 4,5-DOPA dioxygenase extradiol [Catenococcus thiocycli]